MRSGSNPNNRNVSLLSDDAAYFWRYRFNQQSYDARLFQRFGIIDELLGCLQAVAVDGKNHRSKSRTSIKTQVNS